MCGAISILRELPGEVDFDSSVNAFYFIAITATTVGYGDVTPKTDRGKVFVIVFIITGVALAGVLMSKVTEWILAAQEGAVARSAKRAEEKMERDLLKLKQKLGAEMNADDQAVLLKQREEDAKAKRGKTLGEIIMSYPLLRALGIVASVVSVGAIVMHQLEDISFIDGCYWSIVTSTTVGYGDVTPKTDNGKIFASFYAFITIGVMAWAISAVASGAVESKVQHDVAMSEFKLTPEWLATQGGAKGYVDKFDFLKAMLVASAKVEAKDIEDIGRRFDELDVNGDQTLDAKDLLG